MDFNAEISDFLWVKWMKLLWNENEKEKPKCLQGCVSVKRQSGKRIYRMDCQHTHNAPQYNFGIKTNLFNDDKNCLLSSFGCVKNRKILFSILFEWEGMKSLKAKMEYRHSKKT